MDAIDEMHKALKEFLEKINSTGIENINSADIEKLDKFSIDAKGLGMDQGKKLIDNLSIILKSFKEGKSGIGSVSIRITALDFYLKNTQGGASTEEL